MIYDQQQATLKSTQIEELAYYEMLDGYYNKLNIRARIDLHWATYPVIDERTIELRHRRHSSSFVVEGAKGAKELNGLFGCTTPELESIDLRVIRCRGELRVRPYTA